MFHCSVLANCFMKFYFNSSSDLSGRWGKKAGKDNHISSEMWRLFTDLCGTSPLLKFQKKHLKHEKTLEWIELIQAPSPPFLLPPPWDNTARSAFRVPLLSLGCQHHDANLATPVLLEDLGLPALRAAQHLESLWNSYCRVLFMQASTLDAAVSEQEGRNTYSEVIL